MTTQQATLPFVNVQLVDRARALLGKVTARARPIVLLLLRLVFGYALLLAGLGKLQNLERTAGFFASLGLPMAEVNAALVGGFELVGGLLLVAGLVTRIATIPLLVILSVALVTAHGGELAAVFSDPGTFIGAAPVPFLTALLVLAGFGPGRFSLDQLLERRRSGREQAGHQPPPGG